MRHIHILWLSIAIIIFLVELKIWWDLECVTCRWLRKSDFPWWRRRRRLRWWWWWKLNLQVVRMGCVWERGARFAIYKSPAVNNSPKLWTSTSCSCKWKNNEKKIEGIITFRYFYSSRSNSSFIYGRRVRMKVRAWVRVYFVVSLPEGRERELSSRAHLMTKGIRRS